MKRCIDCGVPKSEQQFHRRGKGRQSVCKKCKKERDAALYQQERPKIVRQAKERRAERRAWYVSLKSGKPCTDCGVAFHHAAMQWDHRQGEVKIGNIGDFFYKVSKKVVEDEIKKCDLVCANCHAVRSFNRIRV